MPKVDKKVPISKDITVMVEDEPWRVEIFKHWSPSEIYLAIHKVVPPACEVRITDASGTLLPLQYDVLKTTTTIVAHRGPAHRHTPGSTAHTEKKSRSLLAKTVMNWGLVHEGELLPAELCPRAKPLGKEQYATAEDDARGIALKTPDEWPTKFVSELHNLSKVTKNAHPLALQCLREELALRQADKTRQYWRVQEVMTGDIVRAVGTRGRS